MQVRKPEGFRQARVGVAGEPNRRRAGYRTDRKLHNPAVIHRPLELRLSLNVMIRRISTGFLPVNRPDSPNPEKVERGLPEQEDFPRRHYVRAVSGGLGAGICGLRPPTHVLRRRRPRVGSCGCTRLRLRHVFGRFTPARDEIRGDPQRVADTRNHEIDEIADGVRAMIKAWCGR